MNVGIITFTYGCNYGQRLQNYALQEILKEYAENVYTVPQKQKDSLLRYNLKKIRGFLMHPKKQILMNKRECRFRIFDKNYILFTKKKIGDNYVDNNMVENTDYFVCGSDQIWSPFSGDVNSSMFLTFAPKNKRICYAPSISANYIPNNRIDEYIEYWKGFEFLSLREANLIEFVEKCTNKEVTLVADPTILLNSHVWSLLEKKPKALKKSKYALFYFLGNNDRAEEIKDILVKQKYEIVDLMNDTLYYCSAPDEFLYLVNHASLVITDSYHGTLFSMIFHTPFVVFERKGDSFDMNSRFETLDLVYNIRKRMSNQINDSELFEMDFSYIDKKMDELKAVSKAYLDRCFHHINN